MQFTVQFIEFGRIGPATVYQNLLQAQLVTHIFYIDRIIKFYKINDDISFHHGTEIYHLPDVICIKQTYPKSLIWNSFYKPVINKPLHSSAHRCPAGVEPCTDFSFAQFTAWEKGKIKYF